MIPNQVRKRQPDELVLATFRIPYQKWEKFQEAASASGTTASATLLAFIEDYLARFNAENHPELLDAVDSLDSLDSLESPLETEVYEGAASQLADRAELNAGSDNQEISGWNGDLPAAIDQQMQKLIAEKIEAKFEEFEPIINRLQSQVGQLSKRLDKVEQIVNKFKGDKKTKASELIDVEAVPIDSNLNENDVESDVNPAEDDEFDVGLTQTALCIEFGINPTTLNRHASVRGLSTVEYLHQLTGWLYRNGKYYPPK